MTNAARKVCCAPLALLLAALGGCSLALFQDSPQDGSGDPDDAGTDVEPDGPDATDGEAEIPPNCGDAVVDEGEECDDGNDVAGDGCEVDCRYSCHETVECDDADPCTLDSCLEVDAGRSCENLVDASRPPCDDGNPCTPNDFCDSAGTCVGGAEYSCVGGPCVGSVCDGSGGCEESFFAAGVECDDGVECTSGTVCDGAGVCGGGTSTCECRTTADCDSFQDPNLCNARLVCNTAGYCAADPATAVTCDVSGDTDCSRNVCDPDTGLCGMAAEPDGSPCNDGDPCTTGDGCDAGSCVGGAPACPIGGCIAGCEPATGTCLPAIFGTECRPAGGVCDPAESCNGSSLTCPTDLFLAPGTSCDDGDPCTTDSTCRADRSCGGGAASAPPAPVALAPQNGAYSGSLHASSLHRTLRPLFRWNYADDGCGAVLFTVEVSSECTTPGFDTCGFTAPGVVRFTTTTSSARTNRPPSDLAVSTVAPVGRRYYWRMRACRTASPTVCSAWTPVRYLDVGRVPGDFDGDGRSDVAVGTTMWGVTGADRGAVLVFEGSSTGIRAPATTTLPGSQHLCLFGAAVALAGDLNADGFADLVVGAPQLDASGYDDLGMIYLYYGAAEGLPTTATGSLSLTALTGEAIGDAFFGSAVAGIGDVNADGFADFAAGAPGHSGGSSRQGRAYVYLGRAEPISSSLRPFVVLYDTADDAAFGSALTGLGDVNADGCADFAVGAPRADGVAIRNGRVLTFQGRRTGSVPFQALWTLESPRGEADGGFGLALAGGGDLDGDGHPDLVVGSTHDDPATDAGVAYVFYGAPSGFSASYPVKTSRTGTNATGGRFSEALALFGDVNGDDFDDLLVGAPGQLDLATGRFDDGAIYVFHGSSTRGFGTSPTVRENTFAADGGDLWGGAVGWVGDVQGDGFDDAGVGAESFSDPELDEGSFWLYPGTTSGLASAGTRIDNPSDEAGGLFGVSVAQP